MLLGQRPVTDLPDCPASAGVSFQRDFREQLLLAELFPPPYDPRRSVLRQVFSEPSSLTQYAVNERLRAWSALSSLGFAPKVAWNPRVGDAVVSVDAARAGIRSGTPLVELLSAANVDEDALRELMWRRAPHLLAAYSLIEAPPRFPG